MQKESKTWQERNQFNFDSRVGYKCGKVTQTIVYIFETQSSSWQTMKILNTSAYRWQLKRKELGQMFRQGGLSRRESPLGNAKEKEALKRRMERNENLRKQ